MENSQAITQFEQILEVIDEVIFTRAGRRLTIVEIIVLRGSWQRQTYEQIADSYSYSANYLKMDIGPKLWKLLSEVFQESVSKTNIQAVLERQWRHHLQRQPLQTTGSQAIGERGANQQLSNYPKIDWGEAIDVTVFFGRTQELSQLQQWMIKDRSRLITLLGMGGMGKTALAVKAAQQALAVDPKQPEGFEFVIWRSLRNAPLLETLLYDLVQFLSHQQETKTEISQLMDYLRTFRCLIILDNLETILDPEQVGQFLSGYEPYGELLRVAGESVHQSCFLLTSREKLAVVTSLEGRESSVKSLRLSGSLEAAQALVDIRELVGSAIEKQDLCNRYCNSPLALKIVATSIQDLFEGKISDFLTQDTLVFNGIRRLLDQQFNRLSAIEHSIMYWLAINRDWTTTIELQDDILPPIARADLLEALDALNGRSLIEKQQSQYTLQPVVMGYITEQLIRQIQVELNTTQLSLFNYYALIKTTVKDYVRESQVQLILKPIARQFLQMFNSPAVMRQKIEQIAITLRQQEAMPCGLALATY